MSSVKQVESYLARQNLRGLCRTLKHRDAIVRRRAAQALGELGNPKAVSNLEVALNTDNDQYVVKWSLDALKAIGTRPAIDALTLVMLGKGQQLPRLAAQTLSEMADEQARIAVQLRDLIYRNDWESIAGMGNGVRHPLRIIMQSEQYRSWPSGKRKQILTLATRLGVKSSTNSRELGNMGLFVSGVHTVGDLMRGLRHKKPAVRIAAAEKLAMSGQTWTSKQLYRRFRYEIRRKDSDRAVAIAMATAMARLGDSRAITFYKNRLYKSDSVIASDTARTLAEIGTPDAVRSLFWFAASPPPPPAYRNVPLVLSALSSVGAAAVEAIEDYYDHEDKRVRRLIVEVISRCGHPEIATMLARFAKDSEPDIQHNALDALAKLNSPEAAHALRDLAEDLPQHWVTQALSQITHPVAAEELRILVDDVTSLSGVLLEDDRSPFPDASIQVIQQNFISETSGWDWQAISPRARSDSEGKFTLTLLTEDREGLMRLKVTLPPRSITDSGQTFVGDFKPEIGEDNQLQVRIDRFFDRLIIIHDWMA